MTYLDVISPSPAMVLFGTLPFIIVFCTLITSVVVGICLIVATVRKNKNKKQGK